MTHPEYAIPALAAHMFVFYFGIVADITPPVCLAAYAGSGIAGANPFMTGVIAVKLAAAAYIILFIFIYNPIILLVDYTIPLLVYSIITALLGMIGVSSSVMGYFMCRCYWWERVALFAGGIMLISPSQLQDLIGILLIAAIWLLQKRRPEDDSHSLESQERTKQQTAQLEA